MPRIKGVQWFSPFSSDVAPHDPGTYKLNKQTKTKQLISHHTQYMTDRMNIGGEKKVPFYESKEQRYNGHF